MMEQAEDDLLVWIYVVALHPRHGLVWTDGQNVFLSPVSVQGENLRQSNPIKLGEFE